MANPNITAVTGIYANTVLLKPTGTSNTTWTDLTPSSGTINKLNTMIATNVTTSAATITVSINNAPAGAGTAYRIAYQITVPSYSSLIVVDKTTALYIGESQSVVVVAGTSNAIEMVASFDAIS